MILSKEFYQKCDPTYQKAIDKLERTLADITNGKNGCNHVLYCKEKFNKFESTILNFSKKYLTPKEYWNYYMRYFGIVYRHKNWQEGSCKIAKRALFHLCYNEDWKHLDGFFRAYGERYFKLLDFQYRHDEYILGGSDKLANVRHLQYPHSYLRECFRYFEKKATSHPSVEIVNRYKKMQKLYAKIKSLEGNVEEWFESLLEVEDDEFFMDNVERRLGDNLFDVKLWNLYLTFLEEKKQYKKLLVTLSKYCCFFLDDKEMLEKYHKALIKFVLKKNEFESGENDTKEVGDENDETNEQSNKNIRDNFYNSYCYRLSIGSSVVFENDSLTITPSSDPKLFFKNSVIDGCILLKDYVFTSTDSVPSTFTSKLIPRLRCCTAKFIEIAKQHLSFVELQFLIKHGGVVHLYMYRCEIKDKNGDYIALEDIMKYLPNIEKLQLSNIRTTSKTALALTKQKFYSKLRHFSIDSIYGEPLDAKLFLKFLKVSFLHFCYK
uniref:Uncharacterized protein n=1 Tax=Panagrolaimus davidi TaxID=227884 RepID=A0A914P9A9_9BILA